MADALRDLERTLLQRQVQHHEGSYTATLLADPERIQRKVMEEAFEVCLELGRTEVDRQRVAEEAADLLYHVLVGLVSVGVAVADVEQVIERRRR